MLGKESQYSLKYTLLWSHSFMTAHFPFLAKLMYFNVLCNSMILLLFYQSNNHFLRDDTCSAKRRVCVHVCMPYPAGWLWVALSCKRRRKNLVQDEMTAASKSSHLEVHWILPLYSSQSSNGTWVCLSSHTGSLLCFVEATLACSYTHKCTDVEPISVKNILSSNYTLVTSVSVVISYIL